MPRRLFLAPAIIGLALAAPAHAATPPWLGGARILVPSDLSNQDCRTGVCKHNENTDLARWRGAIWFVHRTAGSQILGPNSSLRIYRSTDNGRTFALEAIVPAPSDRDIRDPAFYTVGKRLFIKAITRLPGFALRDEGAGSISVQIHSRDGLHWSPPSAIGPQGWGFWRVKQQGGSYYASAYEDGDLRVVLYRSSDGVHWRRGPLIYGVSKDTPLEAELVFSPSGKRMFAFMRLDGDNSVLLGGNDHLRTKVCWSTRPYKSFSCPQTLNGVRLDGPVAFYWGKRLFVVARKHLVGSDLRKRTALYELRGNFEKGPLRIHEWGELPSAGDTSYAGIAPLGGSRFLVTWYSSPPALDQSWLDGFQGQTDIWRATLDLSKLR
ncbi:MAG: sialidase family protein [Thermoleophilaceae bacterium]